MVARRNIGKTIKEQRKSLSISLKQLSKLSGVSLSHLGRIEQGLRQPSTRTLQKIAKPLGFDLYELLVMAGHLLPDPDTFKVLPWTTETNPTARMLCDILNPDHTPYAGDTRYVLKRALARAKKMGLAFYVGPEIEYFYFKSDRKPEIIDEGSYFELSSC